MVRVHPTVPNQLNSSPVQRLFDTLDVFAPQNTKGAANGIAHGRVKSSKRRSLVLRLRADTSKHDAEPPLANWTARIETRTATYGDGQTFRWKLSWLSDKTGSRLQKPGRPSIKDDLDEM